MDKIRVALIEPSANVNSEYYCPQVLGDGWSRTITRYSLMSALTRGPCSRTLPRTPWRTDCHVWTFTEHRTRGLV